jgi:hypothetical protein
MRTMHFMSSIQQVLPLGFPWQTFDPFLFCVHHDDAYPAGNENLGPAASLAGRNLGEDFAGKDGWRMYHGTTVPGFPAHPHRGFETVTIVRRGLIDHSDSLGAAARFGRGDVQWLTAGKGISHSEMFPLLDRANPNPLELFQIWLNLPKSDKLVEPHFTMLWDHTIPRYEKDGVLVTVVAGSLDTITPPKAPPRSWASRPDTGVAIWTIKLAPNARWTLPAAPGTNRGLYFFRGAQLRAADQLFKEHVGLRLKSEDTIDLHNTGTDDVELLLLQGKPINEPVVQYGPFVMNSPQEIQQAFLDYRKTAFGGWPWDSDAPVHAVTEGRFARHADGKVEKVEQ